MILMVSCPKVKEANCQKKKLLFECDIPIKIATIIMFTFYFINMEFIIVSGEIYTV